MVKDNSLSEHLFDSVNKKRSHPRLNHDKPSGILWRTFPPFGLSNHVTVMANPKSRVKCASSAKYILRRDMRPSRKAEFGRYLSSLDWLLLFTCLVTCEDLECDLREAISIGLDIIMPIKSVRWNTKDAPWMTPDLKSMIIKRQKAFHELGANSIQYKYYRNSGNRKRRTNNFKITIPRDGGTNLNDWVAHIRALMIYVTTST